MVKARPSVRPGNHRPSILRAPHLLRIYDWDYFSGKQKLDALTMRGYFYIVLWLGIKMAVELDTLSLGLRGVPL